jgi:hypothetical protein
MSAMSLAELQQAFRAHVLGQDSPSRVAAARNDRIAAAARLCIYRHHVFTSLTGALGATFSTVHGVVGDDFFAGMARAFITRSPPTGPVLSEYGAGFAEFVAQWPAAGSLSYLADVARLDWALNIACNAPESPRLAAHDLAAVPHERLTDLKLGLRPGVSLLASPYPIDRIWALNHGEESATVDLGAGGVSLLVFPRAHDAAFSRLEPGVAALVAGLRDGQPLGRSMEQAMAAQVDLDAGAALARLLAFEALAAIDPAA